ncbi:MAG: ABC transporter permease subunit [Thermoprotei archaeon]|jgi:ABC-2 type transport system permease protein
MKTVLYDFKRSFFRISVLLFIVIFALVGIGLSYLVANTIAPQTVNISVIGTTIDTGNNTMKIIGVVLDKDGNGIANAKIYILSDKTVITSTTTNSSGYFTSSFSRTFQKPYLEMSVKSDHGNASINIPSTFPTVFIEPSSFAYGSSIPPTFSSTQAKFSPINVGIILMNINKYTNTGTIVIAMTGLNGTKPNYDAYYTTTSPINNTTGFGTITFSPSPSNLTYNYLGKITDYISVFNININSSNNLLYLKFKSNDSLLYASLQYSLISQAESRIVMSTISSLSPFAQFFPVIFLYLVYAMIAKPRSTGALEFLLARPVTRKEIYINRYIAGILTALTSSGILIITAYISMNILIGRTLDAYNFLLLYVGISGSLIAFFSLMYGISAFLRSAVYLGLSIGLYMLLYVFWGVLAILFAFSTKSNFLDILYLTYYFNPNGLYNFITYFIESNYSILITKTTIINNIAIILSSLIWIILPTMLGYLKFKKINLSS